MALFCSTGGLLVVLIVLGKCLTKGYVERARDHEMIKNLYNMAPLDDRPKSPLEAEIEFAGNSDEHFKNGISNVEDRKQIADKLSAT